MTFSLLRLTVCAAFVCAVISAVSPAAGAQELTAQTPAFEESVTSQPATQESTLLARGPALALPEAPALSFEPVSPVVPAPVALKGEPMHRFWDVENSILFTGVAATSGVDFAVTRSNLQGGGRELNPIVRVFGRSTAGLAVNFGGEIVGVIGVSYFLHRTKHHILERLVSTVNIGASAGAATFGMTHR